MSIRLYRTGRKLFGAASNVALLLLAVSIASLWGNFAFALGGCEIQLSDGRYEVFGTSSDLGEMGGPVPNVDCRVVVLGFGCLLILLMLGYALARRFHEVKVSEMGHCHTCGYNLTGNTSGVCPECGAAVAEIAC